MQTDPPLLQYYNGFNLVPAGGEWNSVSGTQNRDSPRDWSSQVVGALSRLGKRVRPVSLALFMQGGENFDQVAAGFNSNIEAVNLHGDCGRAGQLTDLGPQTWAALGRSNLRSLGLHHCRALTESANSLGQASDLAELSVAYCEFAHSAEGALLAALPRLRKLRQLELFGVRFPFAALLDALAASSVRELKLFCCNLGRAEIAALGRALPRLPLRRLQVFGENFAELELLLSAAQQSDLEHLLIGSPGSGTQKVFERAS